MAATTRGAAASERLTKALVSAAAEGLRPHCSDAATHSFWLSEDPAERQQAAGSCRGRPVLTECREVGKYQSFGVFGAVDRTRPKVPAKAGAAS
jgi:hypothetical protein